MALQEPKWLKTQVPNLDDQGVYRLLRKNPGKIRVQLGRKVFVDDERWFALVDAGGEPLGCEEHREPEPRSAA